MKEKDNFTQFTLHHFKDIVCLREELGSLVEKGQSKSINTMDVRRLAGRSGWSSLAEI